jgi:large subunit ribosomal protein L17
MKHNIKGRKLNRTSSHRKALLENMANSLIEHEQVKTTLPKAKELKRFTEKLITFGKKGGLANKQRAFSVLQNETTVNKLFDVLAKRYSERSGGYTKVLKCGFRTGDSAPMAIVEFVDRDETAKGKKDKERTAEMKKSESAKESK